MSHCQRTKIYEESNICSFPYPPMGTGRTANHVPMCSNGEVPMATMVKYAATVNYCTLLMSRSRTSLTFFQFGQLCDVLCAVRLQIKGYWKEE